MRFTVGSGHRLAAARLGQLALETLDFGLKQFALKMSGNGRRYYNGLRYRLCIGGPYIRADPAPHLDLPPL
jgi:hypothetical protein